MIADDVCSLPAVSTNHIFCYIHMRLHKSYPPLHSPSVVVRWHPWSFCSIPTLMTMTIGMRKNQLKNACAWPPHILHEKTRRFLRDWQDWHIDLQSRWSPGAFYMRKHNDFSRVGGSGISNLQSKWSLGAFYMRKRNDFAGVGGSGI